MKTIRCSIATLMLALPLAFPALAQNPQPGPGGPPDGGQPQKQDGPRWERRSPEMMREGGDRMPMGMMGMWWKSPEVAQKIGLTDDQQQRIDKTFQDFRLQLIDLHANLEKQEAMLQPLVDADQPDEARVMAQVDKVTQARAALERSNAQMMLAIRRVLSPEQWKKLQERTPGRRHFGPGGPPQKPGGDGSED